VQPREAGLDCGRSLDGHHRFRLHRIDTVRVSLPLVKFAEAKRVGMELPQRLFASSSVPGTLSPKITWRLAKNRSPHAIELADPRSIYPKSQTLLS
jgi:hypothetical protein